MSVTQPKSDFRTPPRALAIGMYLFLCSLTMLFAASMMGYILIRSRIFGNAGTVHIVLPRMLWVSTSVLLLGSYTIHRALAAVRRERQAELRRWLLITLILALAFVAIQTPSMQFLLKEHILLGVDKSLSGLVFFLILVHALHVFGGIAAMVIVNVNARRGKYDHESHAAIRNASLYWHFLDIVWLVMFSMFLLTA